jgi:hypothetical protein
LCLQTVYFLFPSKNDTSATWRMIQHQYMYDVQGILKIPEPNLMLVELEFSTISKLVQYSQY